MTNGSRRIALGVLFSVPGLAMASWVVRTPAIRDDLRATTADMGIVLLGMSFGSIVGVLAGGPLTRWLGARAVVVAGLLGIAASLSVVGVATVTGELAVAAAGLFVFGAGMGAAEVAVNVEAADVERELRRPVLVVLHGCYSLGTLVGALAGLALTAAGFSVVAHMLALTVLALVLLVASIHHLPAGTGRRAPVGTRIPRSQRGRRGPAVRGRSWTGGGAASFDGPLFMISAIALSVALAEGAATDWLPLLMVDGYAFNETAGSGIYLLFALCMTVGRFGGAALLRRWSKRSLLRASTLVSVAALLCITMVDDRWVAIAAIVLWGLGASVSFPVALSAAGDGSGDPGARVMIVSMAGYLSMLVGPPALGLVGEEMGLRGAMLVPLAFLAAAAAFAGRLPAPPRSSDHRELVLLDAGRGSSLPREADAPPRA